VQSTGMGGPSTAIVVEELCDLGLEVAIRVGTCGAFDPTLRLGDLVVAREALAADGASRALGAGERVAPDPGLTDALVRAAGPEVREGLVVTADLFYDPDATRAEGWRAAGAVAVEMEAATLLQVARRRGVRGAVLLAVSDVLDGGRERIGAAGLVRAGERLGEVAAAALGARAG